MSSVILIQLQKLFLVTVSLQRWSTPLHNVMNKPELCSRKEIIYTKWLSIKWISMYRFPSTIPVLPVTVSVCTSGNHHDNHLYMGHKQKSTTSL